MNKVSDPSDNRHPRTESAALRAEVERIVILGEEAIAELSRLRSTAASAATLATHRTYVAGLRRALGAS